MDAGGVQPLRFSPGAGRHQETPPKPPDFQGLSFISSRPQGKLVLLLLTETHPTWDGRDGERKRTVSMPGRCPGHAAPDETATFSG